MNWIRRNLPLTLVFALCAAGSVVQLRLLFEAREQARRAGIALKQQMQERDWLASRRPVPSEDNSTALAAEVEAAERQVEALHLELQGRPGWLPPAPLRPIDAYFILSSYVEEMRALAVRRQVALRPDERFGFASHASEGPDADLVQTVHRQRVVLQHVLGQLFESRPTALVSVQRERPAAPVPSDPLRKSTEASAVASRSGGQAGDFFVPDPRQRLRVPELVETDAFRLEFTGQTQTLRAFLNALAAADLPLVVRSVEVEPLPAGAAPEVVSNADAPQPLVTGNLSKFSVMLECIDVL